MYVVLFLCSYSVFKYYLTTEFIYLQLTTLQLLIAVC